MVTIDARHNGPDRSGNGGYVSGLLALEHGGDVVTSTLTAPPPLGVPLTWERDETELRLLTAGGAVVGTARAGSFEREPLAPPTPEEAEAGTAAYRGFEHHPFARCFTCGTHRDEGDGLRLFTGPVGPDRVAGTWTPHPALLEHEDTTLDLPTTWAALDCPGGWAVDFILHPAVLGRMTAQVVRRPQPGEPLLSTGALHRREGRKFLTATALHTPEGELLGRSEQVWIGIDPATFA